MKTLLAKAFLVHVSITLAHSGLSGLTAARVVVDVVPICRNGSEEDGRFKN